jgi:hypothetical protein
LKLQLGTDRRKTLRRVADFRPMTFEEGCALTWGAHMPFLSVNGQVYECRVNGAVKRWKRDPMRAEIPCKYGFRECATFAWDAGMRICAVCGARMSRHPTHLDRHDEPTFYCNVHGIRASAHGAWMTSGGTMLLHRFSEERDEPVERDAKSAERAQ